MLVVYPGTNIQPCNLAWKKADVFKMVVMMMIADFLKLNQIIADYLIRYYSIWNQEFYRNSTAFPSCPRRNRSSSVAFESAAVMFTVGMLPLAIPSNKNVTENLAAGSVTSVFKMQ